MINKFWFLCLQVTTTTTLRCSQCVKTWQWSDDDELMVTVKFLLTDIIYYHDDDQHSFDWCCLQAGREGREKFGRREKRMNPNASTTNKEKRKTKNFMMLRHKVQKVKGKRSFHEKQVYVFDRCAICKNRYKLSSFHICVCSLTRWMPVSTLPAVCWKLSWFQGTLWFNCSLSCRWLSARLSCQPSPATISRHRHVLCSTDQHTVRRPTGALQPLDRGFGTVSPTMTLENFVGS